MIKRNQQMCSGYTEGDKMNTKNETSYYNELTKTLTIIRSNIRVLEAQEREILTRITTLDECAQREKKNEEDANA